jgi:hypothetical protein
MPQNGTGGVSASEPVTIRDRISGLCCLVLPEELLTLVDVLARREH